MNINYWVEEVIRLYRKGYMALEAIEIVKERMNAKSKKLLYIQQEGYQF